ncbi:hypothetical protein ACFLT5_00230 [Chloroflexota bacterium]
MSRCSRLLGDLEGALRAAQGVVCAPPTVATYRVLLADTCAVLQRNEPALVSSQAALTLDRSNEQAR